MPFPITETAPEPSTRAVSTTVLRRWSTPSVILAIITDGLDELLLLPHIIWQARQSGAKVVLAHHIAPGEEPHGAGASSSHGSTFGGAAACATLERMARRLQWLGIASDVVALAGNPTVELPSIGSKCWADRVLLGFEAAPDVPKKRDIASIAELLTSAAVPTCVIGSAVGSHNIRPAKNVTLAVSLDSDCDIALGFASRLAQEQRAKLTVLHVIDPQGSDLNRSLSAPLSLASRLPASAWREAELLCPTSIEIREGDIAETILRHVVSTSQDILLLCSPGISASGRSWASGVGYRILREAECPVFVLQRKLGIDRVTNNSTLNSEKLSARGEKMPTASKKERA